MKTPTELWDDEAFEAARYSEGDLVWIEVPTPTGAVNVAGVCVTDGMFDEFAGCVEEVEPVWPKVRIVADAPYWPGTVAVPRHSCDIEPRHEP